MMPCTLASINDSRTSAKAALSICPSAFDYANVAAEHSRYNTPPTFAIYRPATGRSRQIMSQQVGKLATFRGFPASAWCLQHLDAVQ